jgi:hypothetical protein
MLVKQYNIAASLEIEEFVFTAEAQRTANFFSDVLLKPLAKK